MIAVVVAREDQASRTIRDALLTADGWEEREPAGDWAAEFVRDGGEDAERIVLAEFEGMHLHMDGVDDRLAAGLGEQPALVVFASRHSGETGPLLSAHFTGNWGTAEYGGEDRSLARPAPAALKRAIRRFDGLAPEPFEVAVEATHHGPTELDAPSLYVELGSGPEAWERVDGAEVVAGAIHGLAEPSEEPPSRTVIAVGEPHYGPRVTRIVRETDAAVGHVVPDWTLDDLDGADDVLLECAAALSGADAALLSGEAAERFDGDALPVPVVTEGELRRRSGVPDPLADAVASLLDDGDATIHLGEPATGARDEGLGPEDVTAFEDPRLVRRARRIGRDAATAALEAHALGYAEDADGVVTSVAVTEGESEGEDEKERLIEALADVLEQEYEVAVTSDRVVATRERFDPEAARARGVPEGPAFGRLADGETVEVDGETVAPEDVTETERETFHV